MPYHDLLPFMYLTYVIAGTAFLAAASAILVRLFLAWLRRGSASRELVGQEFVWTLVPTLVFLGLTVLGEIPRGWARVAAGPHAGEMQHRLVK
jgi:asparagine N-glycosylation enzyme membrane subunit Stt3